jgi:hypothetical protein
MQKTHVKNVHTPVQTTPFQTCYTSEFYGSVQDVYILWTSIALTVKCLNSRLLPLLQWGTKSPPSQH